MKQDTSMIFDLYTLSTSRNVATSLARRFICSVLILLLRIERREIKQMVFSATTLLATNIDIDRMVDLLQEMKDKSRQTNFRDFDRLVKTIH